MPISIHYTGGTRRKQPDSTYSEYLHPRQAKDWRDWIEVLYDYGKVCGRSHAHNAKLHYVLFGNGQMLSHDYGYCWSPDDALYHDWARRGESHNVISAEGRHEGGEGRLNCIQDAESVQYVDAVSDLAIAGVALQRSLLVCDAYMVDVARCASAATHQYDWQYHNYGILASDLAFKPMSGSGVNAGRQAARSVRSAAPDAVWTATWRNPGNTTERDAYSYLPEEHFLRLWGLPARGATVIAFEGPFNYTPRKALDYVYLRRTGKELIFTVILEPYRAAGGPKVKAVEKLLETSDAVVFRVTREDGRRDIWMRNFSGKPVAAGGLAGDYEAVLLRLDARGQVERAVKLGKGASLTFNGQAQ